MPLLLVLLLLQVATALPPAPTRAVEYEDRAAAGMEGQRLLLLQCLTSDIRCAVEVVVVMVVVVVVDAKSYVVPVKMEGRRGLEALSAVAVTSLRSEGGGHVRKVEHGAAELMAS